MVVFLGDEWEARNPLRPLFRGLPLFFSDTALVGMEDNRMGYLDVLVALEDGEPCEAGQRKEDVLERCTTFRKRWIRVVAVRDYHHDTAEECWLIVHVDEAVKK